MSIDQYTRTTGGGAVNQFARRIGAKTVEDLTYDGCTTTGVLQALTQATKAPDIVTITTGGNDLILNVEVTNNRREAVFALSQPATIGNLIENLDAIAHTIAEYHCPVILNTIYDPTDGDDTLLAILGFAPEFRRVYQQVNGHIRRLTTQHHFLLADLAHLFHGHGMNARDSWLTLQIEPNLSGATAIAECWYGLWNGRLSQN